MITPSYGLTATERVLPRMALDFTTATLDPRVTFTRTDNTATIPTVTQLRIGSDGTNYASAWVQKIMYWPQHLINAEVQAFSK